MDASDLRECVGLAFGIILKEWKTNGGGNEWFLRRESS